VPYDQHVEHGHGIVLDFELKKGKLHVAQAASKANAHPTLETASCVHLSLPRHLEQNADVVRSSLNRYRLEDLKTGDVVIYRAVPE
jgi:hypothetical protein